MHPKPLQPAANPYEELAQLEVNTAPPVTVEGAATSVPPPQATGDLVVPDEAPPAYDCFTRVTVATGRQIDEKVPLVPSCGGTMSPSASTDSAAGPSSAWRGLLAPVQRGAQYARRHLIDAPQLRERIRKQIEVFVHEAGQAQLAGAPKTAALMYDSADATLRKHGLYPYVSRDPFFLVQINASSRKPRDTAAGALGGDALQLAFGRDNNACVVRSLLSIARKIKDNDLRYHQYDFGKELQRDATAFAQWVERKRSPSSIRFSPGMMCRLRATCMNCSTS